MSIINSPAEVIVHTTKEGKMKPFKIRVIDESGEYCVLKIDKIIKIDEIKRPKEPKLIKYYCIVISNGSAKNIELIYNIETMKWLLKA